MNKSSLTFSAHVCIFNIIFLYSFSNIIIIQWWITRISLLTIVIVDNMISQLLVLFDILLILLYMEESMPNIGRTIVMTRMSNISYKDVYFLIDKKIDMTITYSRSIN